MKNKIWIVIVAYMITLGMNGMEKSPSLLEVSEERETPLPKSPSVGANNEAYREHFENFEYKQNIDEAIKALKYNKKYNKEEEKSKIDKAIKKAATKLSESEYKDFKFIMPKYEFEGLVEAALFLLGLTAYRDKLMQDKMKYENEEAPTLIAVVDKAMKLIDTRENEAKRVILDAIRNYPGKLVD